MNQKENEAKKTEYAHAEAFCLMRYKCESCGFVERIWNSRDGVTPFGTSCPSCGSIEHKHVDWNYDRRTSEDYVPENGDRKFIDLTREKFVEYIVKRVEKYWDDPQYPMKKMFDDKPQAIAALSEDFQEGSPDIVVVTDGKPKRERTGAFGTARFA